MNSLSPVLLSADNTKHPKEDTFIKDEDRVEFVEGSFKHRMSRVAANNAENLWPAVIVFWFAKTVCELGINPQYNKSEYDNAPLEKFLTGIMWTFLVARIAHTTFYVLGINGPIPFRSLAFGVGFFCVTVAACTIPFSLSKFYKV